MSYFQSVKCRQILPCNTKLWETETVPKSDPPWLGCVYGAVCHSIFTGQAQTLSVREPDIYPDSILPEHEM